MRTGSTPACSAASLENELRAGPATSQPIPPSHASCNGA
jgi:hypothetical protein